MGTRNLIAVMNEGEYKIAQYGQWDGYPSGQGVDILSFLHTFNPLTKLVFKNHVSKCSFMSDEEVDSLDENWTETHPQLSRNVASGILPMVMDGPLKLSNSIDFAKDSLMCEFAYVIDLDKNTFECFEGFNTSPLDKSERFYSDKYKDSYGGDKYYPVRNVKSYDIDNLPTRDQFLDDLEPNEGE